MATARVMEGGLSTGFELPQVPSMEARASQGTSDETQLLEAVRSFEAFFVQYLLKVMRQTTLKSGLTGSGFAAETYEAMFDEALADKIAEAGGLGITELLLDDMRRSGWIA